jgi:hypothetical protein
MKLFYVLIIFVFLPNCSFDNKSGIWKDINSISEKNNDEFKDFKTITVDDNFFKKIISKNNDFTFKLERPRDNYNWRDIFYNKQNNSANFAYNDTNKVIYKSKKISRYNINNQFLLDDGNFIFADAKGNILIFSREKNKIINKFNFYKKRYKKIKKKINLIIENNIIYVSDNLSFLYAYDYKNKNLIWAKNYKIPFRSNLKIFDNKLIAANQNNILYFFNKFNGELLKKIPTEETSFKNEFINNLASTERSLFYLNTYGSLYSINQKNLSIDWFINLNQSKDINPNNLFNGNEIIVHSEKIIITSNKNLYIINAFNGSTLFKSNIIAAFRPIAVSENLFTVTKNNLLIALNLKNGNIIYSIDLNKKISAYLNTKKKIAKFKSFMIINNKIFIFLKNSYYIKLDIYGEIEEINKLPSKIHSNPIISEKSLLYLSNKNKIFIVN